MKKVTLYSIIGTAIIILLISVFSIRVYSKEQFKSNMAEITVSLFSSAYIAEMATSEYSKIWRRQIKNSFIMVDGEEKCFYSFSEAVNYKINKFKESGLLNKMDSLMSVSKESIKKIDDSYFADKETKECVKALYLDVSEYCSLANSPSGSLQSFNNRINELSALIARRTEELSLYLPTKN